MKIGLFLVGERGLHVLNGLIRLGLEKDIELKDGTVKVVVDLPPGHQIARAMKEDVMEKIEPLWDVAEVSVEFIE